MRGWLRARSRRDALCGRDMAVVAPRHCRDVDGLSFAPQSVIRTRSHLANLVGVLVLFGWLGSSSCGAMPAGVLDRVEMKSAAPRRRCCLRFPPLGAVWTWTGLDSLSGGGALVSIACGVYPWHFSPVLPSSVSLITRFRSAGLIYWSSKAGYVVLALVVAGCPLRPRGSSAHPAHTPFCGFGTAFLLAAFCRRRKGHDTTKFLIRVPWRPPCGEAPFFYRRTGRSNSVRGSPCRSHPRACRPSGGTRGAGRSP